MDEEKIRGLREVPLNLGVSFSALLQISSMLLFVKRYKEEVLGVGEVALPGEGGALREAAAQRAAKEPQESPDGSSAGSSTNGTHEESAKAEYVSPESLGGPGAHAGPHFPSLLSSTAAAARASFPRRARLSTPSGPVTIAPCGIPAASCARRAVRDWWTWSTSGPIRSCFADATTARASGLGAAAAMR